MIQNQDRSGWFGASDTARIMGNWNTATFARWWSQKLGYSRNHISTEAMIAGTNYEHRILDALGIKKRDRQIRIPWLRLRVNLDGESPRTVHEVKTYGTEEFAAVKAYWQQCQVEMFASGIFGRRKACEIVAYRLLPGDYENYFNAIDLRRVSRHPIAYDKEWIKDAYLPRLRILRRCLMTGEKPHESP